MQKEKILVTGGAGFIGSHAVKELIRSGYQNILVVDNLSKGKKEAVIEPAKLIVADLKDREKIGRIVSEFRPDIVLHFAAAKLADESVFQPMKYYSENIVGGLNLLEAMIEAGCRKIIFSSTAAVYGDVAKIPIDETAETNPVNPYGWTKLMFEQILADYDSAYGLKYVSLRYFNAGGADVDCELGNQSDQREDLISVLIDVAAGRRNKFVINGVYDTPDGSTIRDLIHVNDLASAHVLAIGYLEKVNKSEIINLGSEEGFSVKESILRTKEITGKEFLVEVGPKRVGDPVEVVASSKKAHEKLGWKPKYSSLNTIIGTAWEWEKLHEAEK